MSTIATHYLQGLADRVAGAFSSLSEVKAVMLIGSAAEAHADYFSDLDMCVYYSELPSDVDLGTARQLCGGSDPIWSIGNRADGAFAEAFPLGGVECQIAHTTISAWESQLATVREQLDVDSPLQKALSGMLSAVPLYGNPLIDDWKKVAADYPDALAAAMLKKYLDFFPVWYMSERFLSRDAELWLHQIVIETGQNILGVLAALNHLYYTTFQFKQLDRFVGQMKIAPHDLSARLNAVLYLEPRAAIPALAELVRETIDLVDLCMPGTDTTKIRSSLDKQLAPWKPAQAPIDRKSATATVLDQKY